jgi:O-antigen/teichoic acid export membrane protein
MIGTFFQRVCRFMQAKGRGFCWTVGGQVLYVLGAAVGVKLLTSLLGPAVFGMLALGLTIAGMGNLFLYGPFGHAVLRFYSIFSNHGNLHDLHHAISRFQWISAMVISAVTALAGIGAYQWYGLEIASLVLFSSLFMVTSGITSVQIALRNALGHYSTVAVAQGTDAWLRVLFACAAILIVQVSATAAVFGYALAGLVMAVTLGLINQRQIVRLADEHTTGQWSHVGPRTRELYTYGFPFVLFAVFGLVTSFGDRWLIEYCCGLADVGIYAALHQIAYAPLVVLSNVINQFLLPLVYSHAGDGSSASDLHRAQRAYRLALLLAGACFLAWVSFTLVAGAPMLRILTAPGFAANYELLWLLALGGGIFYFGQILVIRGLYEIQPQRYIFPKAIHAAVFFAAACGMLVQGKGVYGVAYASIFASIAYVSAIIYSNSVAQGAVLRWQTHPTGLLESAKS